MALSNYVVPRTEVALDATNTISVRGLSLEDITFLVSVHKGDMDALVEMFRTQALAHDVTKAGSKLDPAIIDSAVRKSGDKMIQSFLQQFPLLAANVIAVASDEPEAWQVARHLPLPVQVEAILATARLTFEDAEGFKKFVGNVIAVLQSASAHAPQIVDKSKKTKKSTGSTD